jgi:hypothetical protein
LIGFLFELSAESSIAFPETGKMRPKIATSGRIPME